MFSGKLLKLSLPFWRNNINVKYKIASNVLSFLLYMSNHNPSNLCSTNLYSYSVIYKVYICCYGQWLCRVDLCHQANDEEDDGDDSSMQHALLENSKNKHCSSNTDGHRICCSFPSIHVGSHQKFVIAVWEIELFYCFLLYDICKLRISF